ncbi:MAG: ribosomal-processing cysteine protease Prp [Acidaminococcaceae bacterium]|jgi:uncharacterized protein YsxB (DUF464 family)|nr:ribosomal-processing cysteine protease Prp [Acidaminococcaceae bacterium]HAY60698.1 ribosomal-processing cysteine protease Prp [Acidaminococcaceae bacterium]
MITVEVSKNKSGLYTGYRAKGHANDAPAGESVVCAWVSAVTQMALIGLEGEAKFPVAYTADPKSGLLTVQLKKAPDETSQLLIGSMVRILQQLAAECPKDVRVREHGGESKNV